MLELDVNQRHGFNSHWGQHFDTRFFCFHIVKPLMPILSLLPMLCVCKNPNLVVVSVAYCNFSKFNAKWSSMSC